MKLKGRGILVICLLIFGGFAVFDYFRDESKQKATMEASRLMTLNFEHVDEVHLSKDKESVSLKRNVDGWQMLEPVQDAADNEAVDDLVKSSFTERIIEVAKEGSDIDWKLYGLDQPLGTVIFKTTDGKENKFEISGKLNFEDNVFARRNGENQVLVLNSVWQHRIQKPFIEYRDRRLLRHKIASVDDVQLKNKRGLLHVQRTEGRWHVVGRKDFVTDQNKVRALLSTLADARGSQILAAGQKGPVLKSLFTLDLVMDQKKWNAQVGQDSDLGIYAKISDPAQVMRLEPGALDTLLTMTPEDLREVPTEKPAFQPPSEKKENE